ncbi:MAG: hypothetical protein P1U89_23195 [Verrucomicrobiales bacterium]|nr:hypothetical protein [Verrucomicrobiales bacterium]
METDPEEDTTTDTDETSPVRQLTLLLDNRIGALLSIVDLLKNNHFVVLGLSVRDAIDATVVRLIVSDPDSVGTLFMEKGIPFNTTELIVVELSEGASQMSDCLRTILNAETNIHFIYPMLTRPNGRSAIAMCVEDNDFGIQILNEAGFKTLSQDELSR